MFHFIVSFARFYHCFFCSHESTAQSHYKIPRYNMCLDITRHVVGSRSFFAVEFS